MQKILRDHMSKGIGNDSEYSQVNEQEANNLTSIAEIEEAIKKELSDSSDRFER